MKKSLILALAVISTACSDSEKPETNLTTNFSDCPQAEGYTEYNGEEIECQFHFSLTEYEGNQYIELKAHCADLVRPIVINESCEDICETAPYHADSECGRYLSGREVIEVILIKE